MNIDVVQELIDQLCANWPARQIGDQTKALWASHLKQVTEGTARAAVAMLIKEQERWPNIAMFWNAVDRHRAATRERPDRTALPAGVCEECGGDGWVFTTPPGEPSVGEVVPCSRGCKPPLPSKGVPSSRLLPGDRLLTKAENLEQVKIAREILAKKRPKPGTIGAALAGVLDEVF